MTSLNNIAIGSVILNMVENIPSTISGAGLHNIIDQQIYFSEQFTGDTIGTSVADKYQPAIISLSISQLLQLMSSQGIGNKVIKIGELSVTKEVSTTSSINFYNDGMEKLNVLGQDIVFSKSLPN